MKRVRKNQRNLTGKPPHEGWMKINIDASKIQSKAPASLDYIMRDNQVRITITNDKQKDDCPIIMAACLTVRRIVLMAIQKNLKKIIIESDSQQVVNSINRKIMAPKDIINLVEDI